MKTEINYNPDVLSCIANLSSDEIFTPPDIANKLLDTLPHLAYLPDLSFDEQVINLGTY